jgi:hypothetical protein
MPDLLEIGYLRPFIQNIWATAKAWLVFIVCAVATNHPPRQRHGAKSSIARMNRLQYA